jgi:hypothetical protein
MQIIFVDQIKILFVTYIFLINIFLGNLFKTILGRKFKFLQKNIKNFIYG